MDKLAVLHVEHRFFAHREGKSQPRAELLEHLLVAPFRVQDLAGFQVALRIGGGAQLPALGIEVIVAQPGIDDQVVILDLILHIHRPEGGLFRLFPDLDAVFVEDIAVGLIAVDIVAVIIRHRLGDPGFHRHIFLPVHVKSRQGIHGVGTDGKTAQVVAAVFPPQLQLVMTVGLSHKVEGSTEIVLVLHPVIAVRRTVAGKIDPVEDIVLLRPPAAGIIHRAVGMLRDGAAVPPLLPVVAEVAVFPVQHRIEVADAGIEDRLGIENIGHLPGQQQVGETIVEGAVVQQIQQRSVGR